jgi:hypothetical protein
MNGHANIVGAIGMMRRGLKVWRPSWAKTVARCWLEIERRLPEDLDPDDFPDEEAQEAARIEVILFCCEAITEEHDWVGCYPATRNRWKPTQGDLFADDFAELASGVREPDAPPVASRPDDDVLDALRALGMGF